jgi:hypothetical protein
MDLRIFRLSACVTASADFVRKGLRPFKYTASAKCADLSKILEEGPGDYVFTNSLPKAIEEHIGHLLELLRLVKTATCDVDDPNAETLLALLKGKVIVLLCQYERHFPRSEVCRVSHIIIHVMDMVHRWNNVRNYWCFLTERYTPHCTSCTGTGPAATGYIRL